MADKYSDLEICLTWKEKISEIERKKLLTSLKIEIHNIETWEDSSSPFSEAHYYKKFQIDFVHLTKNIVDNTIQDVLKNFDRNNDKSNMLETFQSCIPLHGKSYIEKIRKRIELYPKELAIKRIQFYSEKFFIVDVALQIERKNWIFVYRNFGGYLIRIYHVIEAINKQYHLGTKHMSASLKKMKILPKDIINIYENLDNLPAEFIWKEIERIKYETIDLVNIYFPSIDTNFIYTNKKNRRVGIEFLELD